MAINFVCSCGSRMTLADHFAGTTGQCLKCGARVSIPPAPPKIGSEFEFSDGELRDAVAGASGPIVATVFAGDPPAKPRRDVSKFPVILMGIVAPVAIISALGWHIYREEERKVFELDIRDVKAAADRLDKAGHPEEAYRRFMAMIDAAKDRRIASEVTKDALTAARERAIALYPAAKASRERRMAAKKQAEDDALREVERTNSAVEAYDRIVGESRAYLADQRRLARFSGTLTGLVYLTDGRGTAHVVPGLDLFVIPKRVPRSKISGILLQVRDRPEADKSRAAAGIMEALPTDHLVDVGMAYGMVRDTPEFTSIRDPEARYISAKRDPVWPLFVVANQVATSNSKIDGKFRCEGLKGGDYYLYGLFSTKLAFVEWLVPFKVDRDGVIELELRKNLAAIALIDG